jgi:type IV pilus assembly protein PilN
VILINLLPHREAARKRRKEAFQVGMVLAVVGGLLVCGAVYLWYQAQISAQQSRNAFLQNEIKMLDDQIKEIANIETEIASLRARQSAVEDLQSDRNMPVHLLNELVRQLPVATYITSIKQEGNLVSIVGIAQSNERVSELLRNLGSNTPWFTKPELVEIVSSNVSVSPRDQRRVSTFNIRVSLVRESEVAKSAASSASGVGK